MLTRHTRERVAKTGSRFVSYTVSLKTAEFVLMLAIMSISRKRTCTHNYIKWSSILSSHSIPVLHLECCESTQSVVYMSYK